MHAPKCLHIGLISTSHLQTETGASSQLKNLQMSPELDSGGSNCRSASAVIPHSNEEPRINAGGQTVRNEMTNQRTHSVDIYRRFGTNRHSERRPTDVVYEKARHPGVYSATADIKTRDAGPCGKGQLSLFLVAIRVAFNYPTEKGSCSRVADITCQLQTSSEANGSSMNWKLDCDRTGLL